MTTKIIAVLMWFVILLSLCILITSVSIIPSYAYPWNTYTEEINTEIVVGEWPVLIWDPAKTYDKDTRVLYDGIVYIALKNVPKNKIPSDWKNKNFWRTVN